MRGSHGLPPSLLGPIGKRFRRQTVPHMSTPEACPTHIRDWIQLRWCVRLPTRGARRARLCSYVMRSLLRLLVLIVILLLVPVLPFLIFGRAFEGRMTEWVTRGGSTAQTAGLIVGLLATDVLLPVPSSLVSTWRCAFGLDWRDGRIVGRDESGGRARFRAGAYGGRPVAERLAGPEELQRIEQLSRRYGPSVLVVTRALPVFAEASVLLVGIEGLAWRRFLPPVLLSNLGIALAYSAFGDFAAGHPWLPLALGISLALPLPLAMFARHYLERHAAEPK